MSIAQQRVLIIGGSSGMGLASAQRLARAGAELSGGSPGHQTGTKVSLCPHVELGSLGFDCRDMHDGFDLGRGKSKYPALWSHDTKKITRLRQQPNRWLVPLTKALPGRPLRDGVSLWRKAGRVLIAERLRLNTVRLVAVRMDENVLANVWWPWIPSDLDDAERAEKAMTLWLNSSIGVLILLSHREETEGAWVKFKKPLLNMMPVIDLRSLPKGARAKLARAFDNLAGKDFLPLPNIARDEVRIEVDAAISASFGLPDLSPLRVSLANEPILSQSLDGLLPPSDGDSKDHA
jgi:hypothetical protein